MTAIDHLDVTAATIPTDAPESDGTLAWDSTTIVVVEVQAGGERGVGYSYPHAAHPISGAYAHLIGGARMGFTPEESVCDADHRVWGVSNLFIADGSALPTQGAANPALTIMAESSRLAERLAGKRVAPSAAAAATTTSH